MKKTDWIKARIIDKTHPKYGKVVNVRKVESKDRRFVASIFEIEHCTDIVIGDQLDFKHIDEPVPVMFSLYGSDNGPWYLGYIHGDDLPKIDKIHTQADQSNKDLRTPVFDVHNSSPCYPAKIVLFKDFTPNWNPDWNWNDYCANRAATSK